MKLGKIAYVILGALHGRPGSGYDVKALVDRSTRHFWAVSYGQIYPELRRLAEAGLIVGEDAATGGRARTVYRLTPAGDEALREYLLSPAASCELRDEGLLKLFFADALDDAAGTLEKVRAVRANHAEQLRQLEGIAATATEIPPAKRLVLEYGLGLHRWAVAWCDDVERRLAGAATDTGRL
jgi:PadR family transcriptional regulator, regulatory protein AphA